jgi:RHS repeat-associated protein
MLEATTTVSTSTKLVATSSPFMLMLSQKPIEERADIKGQEIAKIQTVPRTSRGVYDIEIVRIESIKGGVQAFARVWRKDGTQVGFGTDGSVDMERFRIFNPPVLVPDQQGLIVQTWVDQEGKEQSRTLREDPREALLQVIEHNLSVMKNIYGPEKIVRDKVGRTTTTFYPAAGATSPVDGNTSLNYNYGSGSETNFNTIVNRDDALYASATLTAANIAGFYGGQNNWGDIYRGFFLFDTSAIGTDTVSSATISIYGYGKNDESPTVSPDINIYSSNPASTNNVVTGDHDQVGTTTMSSSISYSSWSTSGYNNFALNSTGIANINKTGISKFGTANDNYDTANRISSGAADPSYVANTRHNIQGYFADQTGTTQDPELIVETSAPNASGTSIQDFSYTYDSNGNITQIVDNSTTNTNGTYTYTYDDLNRLTQAVLNATVKSYIYNALGNISSSTDMGSYLYAGDTSTLYANPHAPTSIGGSSYTYDNNGNLLTGGGLTNEWDYRNRLGTTTHSSLTETYGYDESNNRVYYKTSTTTTYYPNALYSYLGATSTKYISANGEPVARIVGSNSSSTLFYIHPDHLGGIHVLSNQSGVEAEAINYYPFGAIKIDDKVSANDQRKYINQYLDSTTNLNYLNARYYEGSRGQFLSQDPVFWENPKAQNLKNPQSLNSYSYAEGNPINKSDPTGRCPMCVLALGGAGAGIVGQFGFDVYNNVQAGGWGNAFSNFSSAEVYGTRALQGAIIGATGGVAGALTTSIAGQALIVGGASGIVGAGGNAYLGDPITFQSVGSDVIIGGLTFGAGAMVPRVPGRLPNFGTNAFMAGKHTQQSAMQLSAGAISNYTSQLVGGFNFSNPSATGGAVGAQNAAKALGIGNSGGGTFVGTYNFGPGVGTFNFGTGSWVSTSQSTPATIKK